MYSGILSDFLSGIYSDSDILRFFPFYLASILTFSVTWALPDLSFRSVLSGHHPSVAKYVASYCILSKSL